MMKQTIEELMRRMDKHGNLDLSGTGITALPDNLTVGGSLYLRGTGITDKMLNHIVIMGRLVREPEYRTTGNGTSVVNFTLAVDRDFSGQNGEKETDFIDCVAWRKTAEFVFKYFRKGAMAVVAGRLQIRSWTDNDGNKRRTAEIVADNVYFGESKRSAENNSGLSASLDAAPVPIVPSETDYAILEGDDEQLPF